jgi:hypothetical protein
MDYQVELVPDGKDEGQLCAGACPELTVSTSAGPAIRTRLALRITGPTPHAEMEAALSN